MNGFSEKDILHVLKNIVFSISKTNDWKIIVLLCNNAHSCIDTFLFCWRIDWTCQIFFVD